jgi:signal transduction histidine kinase
MPPSHDLRARIILASVLLALFVCAFMSVSVYVTFEILEQRVFERRLTTEIDWLFERLERGEATPLRPGQTFFYAASAPADIQRLAPGYHDLGERHVLVRERDGRRYSLVIVESDFEQLEGFLLVSLAIGCMVGVGGALWLGRVTAGRVITPITELASAVTRDFPEKDLPSLGAQDEVGALARAFAARTTELRQFLLRERNFAGDASHELRTPLTVILGAAEVIRLRAIEDRQVVAAAERIVSAASDMREQIGVFLLLSRAPAALEAPRIALRPLLNRELERCSSLLEGKSLAFRVLGDNDAWTHAHPELAAAVIRNLLRNAFLYTDAGEVTVKLEPDRLFVEDTGPGIPRSVRARLFERFTRGHDEQAAGSGLGLAIARRLSEHLDWELHLEDRPGGGSRFVLRFHPA